MEGWQSWSIASVLKTEDLHGSKSSNLFPSARKVTQVGEGGGLLNR